MYLGNVDRFILFGGGQLLAESALRLIGSGHRVEVVTSPRHAEEAFSGSTRATLEEFLTSAGISFSVTDDVRTDRTVADRITSEAVGLSIGAAWIFGAEFISRFQGRLVNLHGARLPQDRGGGGFSWRIMRDDRIGFSLIHQVDEGVDTGEILAYEEYFFPHSCRIPSDYREYALGKNLELIDRFVADVVVGRELQSLSQPEYLSTYWPRLHTDTHGYIDWSWSLRDIERFVCAFDDPYAGAISFTNGRKVRLKKCLTTSSDGTFHPFQRGIIYKVSGGALFVAAGEGSLVIRGVFDEDGVDVMTDLKIGDRFETSIAHLEEARRFRAVYTPLGLKPSGDR